jgi:hypothetical protein
MASAKFEGAPCGCCGTKTRRMYAAPRGTKARTQHPRWWVCENGHKIVRKRGGQ